MEHKGVMIPMVTPFKDNGDIDESALRNLTNYLIEKGVDSLFPAGSTGEGWSLTMPERSTVFEIVVKEARGRVPVYGGTGAISTREAILLAQMARDTGCDAMVVITPYYIVPKPDELLEHYRLMAEATSLPLIPYNNPGRSNVSMTADTVVKLSQIPNIVGLKDSAGNLGMHMRFIKETKPGFAVFQGRDEMFYPSLVLGSVGLIAATGNVAPDLVKTLYRKFCAGDMTGSYQAQVDLAKIRFALELGSFPTVIKDAMEMLGVKVGPARAPVGRLTPEASEKLRGLLQSINLL